MSAQQSIPLVFLKPGRENAARRRHPWIFSGAVGELRGKPESGALVEVKAKDGSTVGVGHWGTRGIAVRMLSFESGRDEGAIVAASIDSAVRLRSRLGLVGSSDTTGYRLVHGEGDSLPGLVVDLYGDVSVVQCHSAGMWRLRQTIADAIRKHDELKVNRVVFRKVEGQVDGGEEDSEEDVAEPSPSSTSERGSVTFLENGIQFEVDPEHGQKTGFFLDQRLNRARIGQLARGKRVLNTFCYTGAFSVYALKGGASHVLSVDASKTALDLCARNVELNVPGASHETLAADCFTFLPEMPDSYELVILDPPAFVKHQRALQRGLRGYESINTHALKRMPRGSLLATFSCSQLVTRDLFRETVQRAAVNAGRAARIIEFFGQAPCHPVNLFHPEGEYLKGLLLYVE